MGKRSLVLRYSVFYFQDIEGGVAKLNATLKAAWHQSVEIKPTVVALQYHAHTSAQRRHQVTNK